jgi:copper chaperone
MSETLIITCRSLLLPPYSSLAARKLCPEKKYGGNNCQSTTHGCMILAANKRLLISGIESFDIDMKEQKVTVKGNVKPEEVFQTVSKTGKKTAFWEGEAAAPVASAPVAKANNPAPAATAEASPGPAAEAAPTAATAEAAAEPEITPAKAEA